MRTFLIALITVALVSTVLHADKPAPAAPLAHNAQIDTLLESIGALDGTDIYTSYEYIGVVADALGKKAYDSKQVVTPKSSRLV